MRMAKEYLFGQMEINMKVILKMVDLEKENMFMKVEQYIKVILKITMLKEMAS